MTEKIFTLDSISPVDIFGINDRNLELIRNFFPKLKLISRGEIIKVVGEETELVQFEERFITLIQHYEKFGSVTEKHNGYSTNIQL